MTSFLFTVSTIFLLALVRHNALGKISQEDPASGPSPKPPVTDVTTFIDTSIDCENQYIWAQTLVNDVTLKKEAWKEVLEKRRLNYTERVAECKKNVGNLFLNEFSCFQLNTKDYNATVADVLDYEMGISGCPESISNTWKTVGIIFIIAFVLALIALVTISTLFYRNAKEGGLP